VGSSLHPVDRPGRRARAIPPRYRHRSDGRTHAPSPHPAARRAAGVSDRGLRMRPTQHLRRAHRATPPDRSPLPTRAPNPLDTATAPTELERPARRLPNSRTAPRPTWQEDRTTLSPHTMLRSWQGITISPTCAWVSSEPERPNAHPQNFYPRNPGACSLQNYPHRASHHVPLLSSRSTAVRGPGRVSLRVRLRPFFARALPREPDVPTRRSGPIASVTRRALVCRGGCRSRESGW